MRSGIEKQNHPDEKRIGTTFYFSLSAWGSNFKLFPEAVLHNLNTL